MTFRLIAVVATVLVPKAVLACPVCFGASDGPMLTGSNMGILALLVVTLGMLGAFGTFIATMARRAARAQQDSRPPGAVGQAEAP
ncbi:MAG: hypothetical protein JSU08_04330 [Acidobacteria bacterium]|nr:hypothetical protein [Acidobacteriota bacterium]